MYASLDDVNRYLPTDKLEMSSPELALFGLDADRIIRGYMAGIFAPTTIALWTSPETTPELLRSIAGRLIAALWYKERYSEDSLEVPAYAQDLYNEAIAIINGIVSGSIILSDVVEVASTGERFTTDDFFPNAAEGNPMFSVNDHFFSIPPTGGR